MSRVIIAAMPLGGRNLIWRMAVGSHVQPAAASDSRSTTHATATIVTRHDAAVATGMTHGTMAAMSFHGLAAT